MGIFLFKETCENLFRGIFNRKLGTFLETNLYLANSIENLNLFNWLKLKSEDFDSDPSERQ